MVRMWRTLLVTTMVLVLAGCGDGDEADNGSAAFAGTWKTTTGTQEVTECLFAANKPNVALTWIVSKSPDATADIVLKNEAVADCILKAKITDKKATLVSGNTCKTSFDAKFDSRYTYLPESTFELGPDGKTATFKLLASGDLLTKDGQGTGYTCAFNETAPLTKS